MAALNGVHRSKGAKKGLGVHLDVLCVLIDMVPASGFLRLMSLQHP